MRSRTELEFASKHKLRVLLCAISPSVFFQLFRVTFGESHSGETETSQLCYCPVWVRSQVSPPYSKWEIQFCCSLNLKTATTTYIQQIVAGLCFVLAQVIEKLLKTNWRSNSRDATSLFLFSVFWTHHNHLFLLVQMAAVREHNNGVEEEEYTLLEYSPGKQRETACQMFIESCYLRYDDIAEVLFSCTLKLLFSGDVHAKQHSWNFNALPSSIQKINSEKTSRTTAQKLSADGHRHTISCFALHWSSEDLPLKSQKIIKHSGYRFSQGPRTSEIWGT